MKSLCLPGLCNLVFCLLRPVFSLWSFENFPLSSAIVSKLHSTQSFKIHIQHNSGFAVHCVNLENNVSNNVNVFVILHCTFFSVKDFTVLSLLKWYWSVIWIMFLSVYSLVKRLPKPESQFTSKIKQIKLKESKQKYLVKYSFTVLRNTKSQKCLDPNILLTFLLDFWHVKHSSFSVTQLPSFGWMLSEQV